MRYPQGQLVNTKEDKALAARNAQPTMNLMVPIKVQGTTSKTTTQERALALKSDLTGKGRRGWRRLPGAGGLKKHIYKPRHVPNHCMSLWVPCHLCPVCYRSWTSGLPSALEERNQPGTGCLSKFSLCSWLPWALF